MFCSDDKKHDGVFAAHALKYLAKKVIPKLDRVADSWRRLTIASDNGPHFAQQRIISRPGKKEHGKLVHVIKPHPDGKDMDPWIIVVQ